MKRILLILLFASQSVFAQEVKLTQNDDGVYEFQEVYEAPGSADELYQRATKWIALAYRSANDVVQLQDPENHIIIAKGIFKTKSLLSRVIIRHTLQIETKEGRYRVTYGPFTYEDDAARREIPFEGKVPRGKRMREKTEEMIQESLTSLKKAMSEERTDDW